MTGVKEEHVAETKPSFRRKLLFSIIAIFLAFTAWLLWEIYAFNNAVQMAKEAGFVWYSDDPITLIHKDWRNALKKDTWNNTWRPHNRELQMPDVTDLDDYRQMLHSLRPTYIFLDGCAKLQNVDGLRNLTSLVELDLRDCIKLQNVDGLRDLTALERINLECCTALQNVDGLKGLTSLEVLLLSNCTELKNVDGLKGLTSLSILDLRGCEKIPEADLRELRTAIPNNTNIVFPNGTTIPPQ